MSNEFEGRDLLTAIVDMHEQNRPLRWIARATGVATRDIKTVLQVAGFTSRDVRDLNMYDRAEWLIQDGASFNEVTRTLHCDAAFLRKWFPGQSWQAGGWGEQGGLIRELMRKQREFERTGKIQTNRDAGFNLRRDQA